MGYSDQKFYNRPFSRVIFSASAGTSSEAGTAANTLTPYKFPKFNRRTRINKIRVLINTAPVANYTVVVARFLNGTSTFATATIGTNTAGVVVESADLSSNLTTAVFAADGQPTMELFGTATASGIAAGTYSIDWETQELP